MASVNGMLEELDAEELMEWAAWERMTGPLGRVRQDVQIAQACSLLANCFRPSGRRPFEIEDFLIFPSPYFGKGKGTTGRELTTPEQQIAFFKALSRMMDDGSVDLPQDVRDGGGEQRGAQEGAG